jgi:hypothetical protein
MDSIFDIIDGFKFDGYGIMLVIIIKNIECMFWFMGVKKE